MSSTNISTACAWITAEDAVIPVWSICHHLLAKS